MATGSIGHNMSEVQRLMAKVQNYENKKNDITLSIEEILKQIESDTTTLGLLDPDSPKAKNIQSIIAKLKETEQALRRKQQALIAQQQVAEAELRDYQNRLDHEISGMGKG